MAGLAIADLFTLALYFVVVTWLGLRAGRRVTGVDDFIMPRRFGKLMMLMHSFGTSTHSDQAVSVASKSYTSGLAGIWYQWMWLFATPFFWLIAPMMRRFRALTTADVFECRFNRSVAILFAVFGLGKFIVTIGTMLKGASAVIEACTAGAVEAHWAIAVMTVLFVVYGIAGGLGAAIVTDFVQGVLTLIFSFLLLPFVLHAVGGLDAMKTSVQSLTGRDDMFSLVAPGEIGLFYIVVIAFNSLVGVVVQPHNMGTCAAGKTEVEGAVGFMGGTFVKRLCTIAWCLTGLAAIAYFQTPLDDPDQAYGLMARQFLPEIMPGMLGLFIAGLLATVMGSCDSFMIASSGLITENVYRPLFPGKSDRHYLIIARAASLVVVAGGVSYALWLDGVIQGLENLWKINSMMAMAFWLGIFWRNMTPTGAWVSTLCTVGTWWATTQPRVIAWIAEWPAADTLRFVIEKNDALQVYLPWQMVFYLTAGLMSGIVGSLLIRDRVEESKLARFYSLLRTPVQPNEVVSAPCTLPEGVTPAPRKVWFPQTTLEIPIPSRRAITGFLVGWLLVGLLIGGVWWGIAD